MTTNKAKTPLQLSNKLNIKYDRTNTNIIYSLPTPSVKKSKEDQGKLKIVSLKQI